MLKLNILITKGTLLHDSFEPSSVKIRWGVWPSDLYACFWKIDKSRNVVFHLFAQKRPLNGLAPNLACGVGPLTLSPAPNFFINCFNGFNSVEGQIYSDWLEVSPPMMTAWVSGTYCRWICEMIVIWILPRIRTDLTISVTCPQHRHVIHWLPSVQCSVVGKVRGHRVKSVNISFGTRSAVLGLQLVWDQFVL